MNLRSFVTFLVWVSFRKFPLVCGQKCHADTAVLDPSLSDVKFTTNVLFERDGVSKPRCAGLCMRTDQCATFTCTQTEGRLCQCRGYKGRKTLLDPNKNSPGTKAYVIHVEDTPEETTPADTTPAAPETTAEEATTEKADWSDVTPCSVGADCTEPHSSCRNGRCMCIHGYYYSVGAKACREDCPPADLQDTYLRFEGCVLWGYNYGPRSSGTVEACKSRCDEDSACIHYEYDNTYKECFISHTNTRLYDWYDPYSGPEAYNHYQRNCA